MTANTKSNRTKRTAEKMRGAAKGPGGMSGAVIDWPGGANDGKPNENYRNGREAIRRLADFWTDEVRRRKFMKLRDEGRGNPTMEVSDPECALLRQAVCDRFGFDPGKGAIFDAVDQLCAERVVNPIKDYLNGLVWDGVPRLDTWLTDYWGAEDTPFNRAVGRIFLIAGARRARKPGCKFDELTVFEGPEGIDKSTGLKVMAGDYFSDAKILGLGKQAQQEALQGVWIYEIAELAGLSKAEIEEVTAFFSRDNDRARPAYGRNIVDQFRTCIFAATHNPKKGDLGYLKKQTGNRRVWPVPCGITRERVDIEGLIAARDQLWAEAARAEAADESSRLDPALWAAAGELQNERTEVEEDVWEAVIQDKLGEVVATVGDEDRVFSLDIYDILTGKFDASEPKAGADGEGQQPRGVRPVQLPKDMTKRVVVVMRKLGWTGPKDIRIGKEGPRKGFARPKPGRVKASKGA